MGGATRLLLNCPSMEVSSLLEFIKSGVEDFRIPSIFGLMLRPQGGAVVTMRILFLVTLVPVLSLEDCVEGFLSPL